MRSSTRCAEVGPTPGISCITRNPATRSRGFSTKRIGVAHETGMLIDGSPPVGAVPNQFAAGFAAPLDFLEAPLFRGQ
jgi:hypothetical protein